MTPPDPVAQVVDDFDPDWLAVREPADHDARHSGLATALATALAAALRPTDGEVVIHDLGSGTGSLARWLAPRLPGPQRWVLHDRDPALLALARERTAGLVAADGSPVRVGTAVTDLTALRAADLTGAAAVTASALLDLFTAAEADALAATCAAAGAPVLWTLSVTGAVELDPPDPLDGPITTAFNDHQRRSGPDGALLGPDAPQVVAEALRRHGMQVRASDSPWRLGAPHAGLLAEWLRGRVDAAVEQDPALAAEGPRWLRDRLAAVAAGRLSATVGHRDLFAVPAGRAPGGAPEIGRAGITTGSGDAGYEPAGLQQAGPVEAST